MSTQLFEGKRFTLTRFWGGDKRGVMYQITQYNETKKCYDFVQLNEKNIKLILRRIKSCHT